jgi:hypothetical protein
VKDVSLPMLSASTCFDNVFDPKFRTLVKGSVKGPAKELAKETASRTASPNLMDVDCAVSSITIKFAISR